MKIEIKLDPRILTLSNEHLNNFNFVEMTLKDEYGQEASDTVSIDELYASTVAFRQIKEDNKE